MGNDKNQDNQLYQLLENLRGTGELPDLATLDSFQALPCPPRDPSLSLSPRGHGVHLMPELIRPAVSVGTVPACSVTFPNEYSLVPVAATCFPSAPINGLILSDGVGSPRH